MSLVPQKFNIIIKYYSSCLLSGYLAYISMLHVENAHNHPILRVFCDILSNAVSTRGAQIEIAGFVEERGGSSTGICIFITLLVWLHTM
jgi:hypothetical protein